MTMLEQGLESKPDHFYIHRGLASPDQNLEGIDPQLLPQRDDYNINFLPGDDVVEWAAPITETLDDDTVVYPSSAANFHFTVVRLGLASAFKERTLSNFMAVLEDEFAVQKEIDVVLLPPEVGEDAIMAEFDDPSQTRLSKIRKRIIRCGEYALGSEFTPPAWHIDGTPERQFHMSLEYLKQHTEADKQRLQAKIDAQKIKSLKMTISGFTLSLQTSRPQHGDYQQNPKAEIKFQSN